jgi:uroporphyrinogen decarboxylase
MAGEVDMSRLEQVRKAIRRQGPEYVPLLFFNGDRSQSDIIIIDVARHFLGPGGLQSEWGFTWDKRDETMGQPTRAILEGWQQLDGMTVPDARDPSRLAEVDAVRTLYGDRYYIASLVLTGFTIMTFLRGFSQLLIDLYEEPAQVERLADIVFGFEKDVIRTLPEHGFHAVAFYDDWGTQQHLVISPSMWRRVFKPRYKRQFDLAHSLGLDVYFHSCGYIYDLIPDLIDMGVDLLNLSQPNLYDIEQLGRAFGGRTCFVCPVSYQTTAISGSKDDIEREVRRLVDNLGSYHGGLVGYVEHYESIGMTDENFRRCVRAFQELGRYPSSGTSQASEPGPAIDRR